MRPRTKKQIKENFTVIVYSVLIIFFVVFQTALDTVSGPGTTNFVIFLTALLIIINVLRKPLEADRSFRKIMTIIMTILFLVGIVVHFFF